MRICTSGHVAELLWDCYVPVLGPYADPDELQYDQIIRGRLRIRFSAGLSTYSSYVIIASRDRHIAVRPSRYRIVKPARSQDGSLPET